MAESEEELKSLLMKVKEESEKIGLKLNIQETRSHMLQLSSHAPTKTWCSQIKTNKQTDLVKLLHQDGGIASNRRSN